MEKVTNPFGSGWKTHEKRGGSAAVYDKYETQLVVIVSRVNDSTKGKNGRKATPVQIQFSQRAYNQIGRPKRVVVRANDTLIAFIPVDEERPPHDVAHAYTATFDVRDKEHKGRPAFNMKTVIEDYKLTSGVYNAQVFVEGNEQALVIISSDRPSQP